MVDDREVIQMVSNVLVIISAILLLFIAKKIKSIILVVVIAIAIVALGLKLTGETLSQRNHIELFQTIFK